MSMQIKIGAPATGSNFFPRDEIVKKLLRAMQSEHVLFLAPRRTGKTSVLLHLKELVGKGNNPVRAVFLNLEEYNHPKLWLKAMATELSKIQDEPWQQKLKQAGDLLPRLKTKYGYIEESDWSEQANSLMEDLNVLNEPVWFLLDEFPTMVDLIAKHHGIPLAESTMHWIRCIRQHNTDSPVRFLLTGSIGLDNVLRRLGIRGPSNDLRREFLTPLSNGQALELALTLARDNQVPLSETLVQEYLQRLGTAVWPYFIQLFIAELQETEASPNQPVDLEKIYRQVAQGKRNQYSDNMWTRLGDVFDKPLAATARAMLKLIATKDLGIPRDELRARAPQLEDEDYQYVMEVLEHDGYLSEAEDGNIRFFSHLLRDYWRWKGRV